MVARCRHHSVERARGQVDVLKRPYDDVDGGEVAGENGCQMGTQLDRSHSGTSGNESLRGLACARSDLDHDWRPRQYGDQLVEEVVGVAGAHAVVELGNLIEAIAPGLRKVGH